MWHGGGSGSRKQGRILDTGTLSGILFTTVSTVEIIAETRVLYMRSLAKRAPARALHALLPRAHSRSKSHCGGFITMKPEAHRIQADREKKKPIQYDGIIDGVMK